MSARLAFAVPLALLAVVTASHLGARSGYYRSSRPDAGLRAPFLVPGDGAACFADGVPVASDAAHAVSLARLFRGAPAARASGIMDERPLVPFAQSLLGAGWVGPYVAGVLANLVFLAAACACSVHLALRERGDALVAALFGSFVAVNRGVGFYAGTPDVHAAAFAWYPIAAWLFEVLAVGERDAPATNVALFGLALGLASITYLGDMALLAFAVLYGVGRTPLARLLALAALALAVVGAWRLLGRAIGLGFDAYATQSVGNGVRVLGVLARDAIAHPLTLDPDAPRAVPFATLRMLANGALVTLKCQGPLGRTLTKALVPCFGWPLIALALAGLVPARPRERRLALALAAPAIAAAWPINVFYDAPRITYPATAGLALLAALALDAAGRAASRGVARLGATERVAGAVRVAVAGAALLAYAAFESSDVFARPDVPRAFHFGS